MSQLHMNQVKTQSFRKEKTYGVYLKENERLMPFMNLEKFVVTASGCPIDLLLQQFQNILRELLSSFCGGWALSTTFKLIFPSFYWNSKVDVTKMKRLYPLLIKLRESPDVRKLSMINTIKKIERLLEHPELSIDEASSIISESHKILFELISEFGQTIDFGSIEVESLGDPLVVYKNLKEDKISTFRNWQRYCKDNLSRLVSGVYIHGSMATLNYTEFSDLDVILIPRLETIEDPKTLKEFAFNCALSSRFLYKFNHLQHSGYLIISPHDLRYYNASILPPQVFSYSKVLYGNDKIDIAVRDSRVDYLDYTWKMIQNTRGYLLNGYLSKNMWHLCVFTSFILILPVLYLQILNDYVYKTFSFDRAKKYFPPAEWEAVDMALEIRDIWRYQPTAKETLLAYTLLELRRNPILFEYLMKRYSQRVSDSLQKYLNRRDFYKKAFLFSEAVARRVYELATEFYKNSSGKVQCSSTT